jgi:uncharacterized protein with PIN domain
VEQECVNTESRQQIFEVMNRAEDFLFAADRMLGKLARMLRLLGYDTLYEPALTAPQLLDQARRDNRVVLTRGDALKRFPGMENILSLKSEYPPEQLRDVVERFRLDTTSGLWTRCTLCNARIEGVAKLEVESQVPAKVFEAYQEFYRCTGCRRIYWRGSHAERIVKNLAFVFQRSNEDEEK